MKKALLVPPLPPLPRQETAGATHLVLGVVCIPQVSPVQGHGVRREDSPFMR